MSRFIFSATVASATVAIGLALSASAFAQTAPNASPACARTAPLAGQNASSTTTMADTSSDSGNTGAGASSASMGTGSTDKTGMMSPCVPGLNGQNATGALPNSSAADKTP